MVEFQEFVDQSRARKCFCIGCGKVHDLDMTGAEYKLMLSMVGESFWRDDGRLPIACEICQPAEKSLAEMHQRLGA